MPAAWPWACATGARCLPNWRALATPFRAFFADASRLALGVCNGCQMFAELAGAGLIAGAQDWPRFTHNRSGRFEARLSQETATQIAKTCNPWFFHLPLEQRQALPSYAFAFSPAEVDIGRVYEFKLNHVVLVDHPMELVRTRYVQVQEPAHA